MRAMYYNGICAKILLNYILFFVQNSKRQRGCRGNHAISAPSSRSSHAKLIFHSKTKKYYSPKTVFINYIVIPIDFTNL